MSQLNTDVRYIKGIGEKKALALNKLGVFSLYDLLSFFPRRYEDRSQFKPIALAMDGESVCIQAIIADAPRLSRIRKGLDLVRFHAVDDSGSVEITYFNQSYIKDNLHRGDSINFYGKMEVKGNRRTMVNPVFEREGDSKGVTGRIIPIYRLTAGINQASIVSGIRQSLDYCLDSIEDILPNSVRNSCKLSSARYAYENIHFPASFEALDISRRRFIFEELFVLACALGKARGQRKKAEGIRLKNADITEFYSTLPFSPTGAQRRSIDDSIKDMCSGAVMNRLVQGDVGSGKTLVAAAAIWYTWKSGHSSAFMAPTEILAEQHYSTLTKFLSPFGIKVGKLTGSMTAKEKRIAKEAIKNGDFDLIVGTHALFSDDVEYNDLALVVTDEQHRFGVAQRSALIGKSQRPHVLVMSATPIPRPLALIINGDLDVSIIDELPPGREKVDTFAVNESYRERLNAFIDKQCAEGRQVFVVCPMVEENEELAVKLKSAQEHTIELSQRFPHLKVDCIHGKMKPKDKDRIMASFIAGETNVLVSTTVIEVGVDVPNAALMIIENADRFGLSQLHQLRGRVGRGKHKSYCVLVSDADSDEVKARLSIMCKTNDGFKISEEDLRLRGPGDFFGSRQHGLPEMHIADLGADVSLMQLAQQEANKLLANDPKLQQDENKLLQQRIDYIFSKNTNSFN